MPAFDDVMPAFHGQMQAFLFGMPAFVLSPHKELVSANFPQRPAIRGEEYVHQQGSP